MLTNGVLVIVVLAASAALAWLAHRVLRSTNRAVKWLGSIGLGFLAVLLFSIAVVAGRGFNKVYGARGRPVTALTVERNPERIARGEHIGRAWCSACHSTTGDVPLSGGKNLSDDAHLPLGDIIPFNLTPGGPLKDWSDGEVFRAIREAADKDGKTLAVMSSQRVRNLSDDDIQSVIAYLRAQPAIPTVTRPERFSFLTVFLAGANMLSILPDLAPEHITAPPRAPTREYGEYVARWTGCDECHGESYLGGNGGVAPKGPNLRVVKGWTAAQFIQTLRTGVDPFGKKLDPEQMPYKNIGRLDDDELTALHSYLASLPMLGNKR